MHKKLAEAALFMSTRPLGLDELGKIMGMSSLGFVKQVMEELQRDYDDRGMEVVSTPEGWSMQARRDFLPKIAHLTPYHDLSEGTKRTLALIVYKEPVKQSELIKTQGNKAYAYIKDLVVKGLIKAEKDGRTKSLHLTPEFERYFGEEKTKIKQAMDLHIQQESQKKAAAGPNPQPQFPLSPQLPLTPQLMPDGLGRAQPENPPAFAGERSSGIIFEKTKAKKKEESLDEEFI